jgi:lipopolysaccharide assembly outer membrane protein LptD (OstA)
VASKWTLLAQHRVDLLNQQTQESTIGFEFTNCCFQTRLVNRYWLDTADQDMQRGIFFELALRNLSSVGQQLTGANQTRMAEFMQGITSYNENHQ